MPANLEFKIPTLWVNQVFTVDPAAEIRVLCLDRVFGNIQPYEIFVLLTILKSRDARKVFEIGTFDGRTTRNLAANVGDGHVYTLDLPPSVEADKLKFHLDDLETPLILREKVGARYVGTPEQQRITQLFGDSATFSYEPYLGQMDLVFVDGSHSIDYVRSDTENAFRMIKPDGVVVWHDYGSEFPDVPEFLDGLASANKAYCFLHMRHTLLVAAIPVQDPASQAAQAFLP